jgi:hypothetical protein
MISRVIIFWGVAFGQSVIKLQLEDLEVPDFKHIAKADATSS